MSNASKIVIAVAVVLAVGVLTSVVIQRRNTEMQLSRARHIYDDMVPLGGCLDKYAPAVENRLQAAGIHLASSGQTGATTFTVPRSELSQAKATLKSDPSRISYEFFLAD